MYNIYFLNNNYYNNVFHLQPCDIICVRHADEFKSTTASAQRTLKV